MTQLDLGQATIVYDDPDEGQTELSVDNEQVVYVRDHWAVRTGTDDAGNDLMRQIPRDKVHYVERNVERFEDRAGTVRSRVESVAREFREKLPVDVGDAGGRAGGQEAGANAPQGEPVTIQVDDEVDGDEGEDVAGEAETEAGSGEE